MDSDSVSLVGQQVGNWRLTRRLGEGAFGAVYEAENAAIAGKRAAVKILHPHLAVNADLKRRFINEASAASRAEHENLIQIFDGGITPDGTCYLVMEFLRGRTLAAALEQDGALGVARSVAIVAQIAAGLAAAHDLGIVHRDLKPENIFLLSRPTQPDFVKVLDFGIAKLSGDLDVGGGGATRTGTLLGTPAYMSPEQWRARKDLDHRSDLYTLGIILWECLAGRRPFEAEDLVGFMTAHVTQPLPRLDPSLSTPELDALVGRMCEKEAADRPATLHDVLDALRGARPSVVLAAVSRKAGPGDATAIADEGLALPGGRSLSETGSSRSLERVPQAPSASQSSSQPCAESPAAPAPATTSVASFTTSQAPASLQSVQLKDGELHLRGGAATASPQPPPFVEGDAPSPSARPEASPSRSLIAYAVGVFALAGVGAFAVTRRSEPAAPAVSPAATVPDLARAQPRYKLPPGGALVPAGAYPLGTATGDGAAELRAHPVELPAFAIGKQKVSHEEYNDYVEETGAAAPWPPGIDLQLIADRPVVGVTQADAAAFCAWRWPGGKLPSEQQWEAAARGRAGRRFPWGEDERADCAHVDAAGKALEPASARACGATPEGVLQLLGNTREWTSTVAAPERFIVRGAAFSDPRSQLSTTLRQNEGAASRLVGFRCVAPVEPLAAPQAAP